MNTLFAEIILPLYVQGTFTYRVPSEMNDYLQTGQRVLIQFGKTRFYTGIVYKIHENPPKNYTAKYIDSIIDMEPLIRPTQLKFWEWIAFYYCCGIGEVMNAALPSGLKLSSETHITLNPDNDWSSEDLEQYDKNEKRIIEKLSTKSILPVKTLESEISKSALNKSIHSLIKAGKIKTFEDVKDKFKPLRVKYIRLNKALTDESIKKTVIQLEKKAYRQLEVLLYLISENKKNELNGLVLKTELLHKFEASAISALIRKKILIEEEKEIGRLKSNLVEKKHFELTEVQQKVYNEIKVGFEENKTCLLHGITGSGKTEIYFKLIEEVINNGKEVLFLVPEIALTTQLIDRFRRYFGNMAGVYHSRFSENEKVEIWNALSNHAHDNKSVLQYKIILGARSAVFLPFKNLGLIIVDEEHEGSFKQQDPAPRYNARDAAIYLSTLYSANILLGSATPSVESFYLAKQNKYLYVQLNQRFGNAVLPQIISVQKPNQIKKGTSTPLISDTLKETVDKALKNKEQIILFQNRRGFAPITECRNCGWIPQCPNCDVSLIFHKNSNRLICHYCGHNTEPPSRCDSCQQSTLMLKGAGTEKIEEDASVIFPNAKISRLDLDNTKSKNAYHQIISDFSDGKTNMLIGTQMVTKGLDFDHVSVVGILNADQLLNFPDFRAYEKSFQLMTQVGGRAGRKDKPGVVIIQSARPEHEIIQLVKQHDFIRFYDLTLSDRKNFLYPPFCRLIEITINSKELILCDNASYTLAKLLTIHFGDQVLGPEYPLISRIKNEFRKRILLKVMKNISPAQVRKILLSSVNEIILDKSFKNVRIIINVDPQ